MSQTADISTADALDAFAQMGLDSGAGIPDSSGAASSASTSAAGAEGANGDHHTSGASAGAPAPAPNDNVQTSFDLDTAPFTGAAGTTGAQPQATPGQAPGGAYGNQQGNPQSRATKLAAIKDPALQEHLQRMGNGAFNHFYDIALKMQAGELVPKAEIDRLVAEKTAAAQVDIEQAKAARYFDHEDGYKLTPEYQQVAQEMQQMGAEQQFWQEQAAAIQQGQPFQWLQQGADGKLQLTGPFDPRAYPQAMGAVMGKISSAGSALAQLQAKVADLPKTHKAQYESFNGKITGLDKELFGNVKNPAFAPLVTNYLNNFPKFMQGRPEIQLLAKALAAGSMLMENNKMLNQRLSGNQAFGNAMVNSAPAPTNANRGPAPNNTLAAQISQLESMVR